MRLSLFLVALALLLSTALAATQDQAAVASLSKLISSLEDTLPVDSLEQIEEEDDLALGATGGSGVSGSSGSSSGGGTWTPPPSTSTPVPTWLWNRFGPYALKASSCTAYPTEATISTWTSALTTYYGFDAFMQFTHGCFEYSMQSSQYSSQYPVYFKFYVSLYLPVGTTVEMNTSRRLLATTVKDPCTTLSGLNLSGLVLDTIPGSPCKEQDVGVAGQFSFESSSAAIVESDATGVQVNVLLGSAVTLATNQYLRVEILCVYSPASNLIEQRFEECPKYMYVGRSLTAGTNSARETASASFTFKPKNTQFYDGTTPVSIIINPNSVDIITLNSNVDPNTFMSNCAGTNTCGVCGEDGNTCIATQPVRQYNYSVNRQKQVMVIDVQDEDAYRTVRHAADWVPRCAPDMPQEIEIMNAGDTLANQKYYQTGARGYYYCTYTGVTSGNWAVGIRQTANIGTQFGRPETWQVWWNPTNKPNGGILRYQSYSTRQDFAGLQGPWQPINGFKNDRAPIIVHYTQASNFKTQGCLLVANAGVTSFNGFYVIEDTMKNYVNLIRYRQVSSVQFEKHIIVYQTMAANNANTGYWYLSMDGDFSPYYQSAVRTSVNNLAKVTDTFATGSNAGVTSTSTIPTVTIVPFMVHWINGMSSTAQASMTAAQVTADDTARAYHAANCPASFVAPLLSFVEVCVQATGSSNQQINQVYRLVHPARDADGNDVASNLTIYIGESFTAYSLSKFTSGTNSGYFFLSFQGKTIYYTNKASLNAASTTNSEFAASTYLPYTSAVTGTVIVNHANCPDKYA